MRSFGIIWICLLYTSDAQLAQNQEIQAVYAKYGVSPTGSCLYMLIQMPILFALYRVIYAIPAYVGRVKEAFFPLVDNIIDTAGATELVQNLSNSAMYSKQFTNSGFVAGTHSEYVQNTIIDCLNKASTADFASISEKSVSYTHLFLTQLGHGSRITTSNGFDYLVCEFLTGNVENLFVRILF